MGVRNEVRELAALGPLPDKSADEDVIARHQAALRGIKSPVTDEEAALLVKLFGPDDCHGLAWTLMHLIESAPSGPPIVKAPNASDNEWLRLLWDRKQRLKRQVPCPRCGQDWLVHVRLVHLSTRAIFCPECNALWQTADDVGPSTFEDYGTFMMRQGRKNPDSKGEIEIERPLLRDETGRRLFCNVGDVVEIIADVTSTPLSGEEPVRVGAGSRYQATGLVGWGWDLTRIAGDGPDELRIINSDMPKYVRLIPAKA